MPISVSISSFRGSNAIQDHNRNNFDEDICFQPLIYLFLLFPAIIHNYSVAQSKPWLKITSLGLSEFSVDCPFSVRPETTKVSISGNKQAKHRPGASILPCVAFTQTPPDVVMSNELVRT